MHYVSDTMGKFKNNFPEAHVTPHAWFHKATTAQYTATYSLNAALKKS